MTTTKKQQQFLSLGVRNIPTAVCWALAGNPGAGPGDDFTGLFGIVGFPPRLDALQTVGKVGQVRVRATRLAQRHRSRVWGALGLQRRRVA